MYNIKLFYMFDYWWHLKGEKVMLYTRVEFKRKVK
jgi:hypothetical protein